MVWVLKHCQARAGRPNQEDFNLGCPRCCCTVPGRGHRTGPSGRRAIQVIQSLATVSVPGGIGLTKALARTGPAVRTQEDFKSGRFQVGLPPLLFKLHITGQWPLGQRFNIQSVVTVQGICPEQDRIHRITGTYGPAVPVHYIYVYLLVHLNIYMHL